MWSECVKCSVECSMECSAECSVWSECAECSAECGVWSECAECVRVKYIDSKHIRSLTNYQMNNVMPLFMADLL